MTIEKEIELKAPRSRVWRALTDYKEFGEWFRVKLDGPFQAGQKAHGNMLYPGYEHLKFAVTVVEMVPETRFSYRWHPYAVDADYDYSQETPTLVEFTLEETPTGTLLKVSESGFEHVPAARRDEAFRMNEGGWKAQMENIERYVSQALRSAG